MGRALLLVLMVGWVTGCGGDAQGSKPSDAQGTAGAGNQGGAAGAVPPTPQGAFWVNVKSVSPAPAGKMCPSGASLTFDLPAVDPTRMPPETLDADTYVRTLIDGEDAAQVTCTVQGTSTFSLEGKIALGSKSFTLSSGTLAADKTGTARITLRDSGSPGFPGTLASPSANCALVASAELGNSFQVKPGSIWGHFSCPSIEQAPSDYCQASGFFVLENCEQ
jgi:hypothetical protein